MQGKEGQKKRARERENRKTAFSLSAVRTSVYTHCIMAAVFEGYFLSAVQFAQIKACNVYSMQITAIDMLSYISK